MSEAFEPRDAAYEARVRTSFGRQPAMSQLFGARMTAVRPGATEIELEVRPDFLQQQGTVHGGIVGALVDSATGYAALSLMPAGSEVVTVEYKIHFLRPATGERLIARGHVVRPGRTLYMCVGEVFAVRGGEEIAVAHMTTTMMAVPDRQAAAGSALTANDGGNS